MTVPSAPELEGCSESDSVLSSAMKKKKAFGNRVLPRCVDSLFILSLFKEGDVIACYSFLTYGPLRAFYPPNRDTPQKTDHNTGNYMPYSLRQVCGLFYVPQDYEH